MNLKNFLIASIFIHVFGAITLYFYYNPISFKPKPVGFFEETAKENKTSSQTTKENKAKEQIQSSDWKKVDKAKNPSSKTVSKKRSKKLPSPKHKKAFTKTEDSPSSGKTETNNITENNQPSTETNTKNNTMEEEKEIPPTLNSSQEQALSDAKEPPSKSQQAFIETEDSSVEIDMENMEEITTEEKQSPLHPTRQEDKTRTKKALGNKSFKLFKNLKQKRGNPSLSYPDFARRNAMQGTVSVLFFVTEQGLTDQIQLLSSSGHSKLDNFVLRVLSQYEFFPGQKGWVKHDISFKLDGEEIEFIKLREKK